MSADQDYMFASTWVGSTITGEKHAIDGSLMVSVDPDGSVTLTGSYGRAGSPQEECEHFQYPLTPEEARRLGGILLNVPGVS